MAKRRDDRSKRESFSYRARLNRIVAALVTAAVAFCVLTSWEDKNGTKLFPSIELSTPVFVQELLEKLEPSEIGAATAKSLPGSKLEVHFLDVGQAESILIKGPEKNFLIDAGENNNGHDVVRYIKSQGVRRLDTVIGTHPHSDHVGGLDTVILEMDVNQVVLPDIPEEIFPTTQTYTDLLAAIEEKGLEITPAKPGKRLDLGDGAQLVILAPVAEYADLNNMSVMSRLSYGETSFMFTGDAEAAAENDLRDSGARLKSDVLNAGHHGSGTSTTEAFLQAVSPRIAVISCGLDNSYEHPHRVVIERLQQQNIRILRTDLNGAVVIESDGERLSVSTEK